jgi:hypothetical protein
VAIEGLGLPLLESLAKEKGSGLSKVIDGPLATDFSHHFELVIRIKAV